MSIATLDPPASTTPQLMTAEEFWDFCQLDENRDRNFELIRGEIVEMPNPSRSHGAVCANIVRILGNHSFRIDRGYVVSNDSGVILFNDPDTVVGPDVAYFTEAASFGDILPKWGEMVPILAVEVLSPSDKMKKVLAKVGDYLRSGVSAVWLVDFEERFLTLFRTTGIPRTFGDSDTISGEDYLPEFASPVADFFRIPGSKPATAP